MRTRLQILAATCCLLLAACGGDSDNAESTTAQEGTAPTATPELGPEETTEPAFSVTSSDGAVVLDVPAGAVPAGTEITIEPTTAPDGTDAAYDFGPDGLEFTQPATLTWVLDGEPEVPTAFLLASVSADGTVEVFQQVDVELTTDATTLTAPVHHFTTIGVRQVEVQLEQVSPGPTVALNETFEFEVAATPGGNADDANIQIVSDLSARVAMTPMAGAEEWDLADPTTIGFTCSPEGPFTTTATAVIDLEWAVAGAEPQRVSSASTVVRLGTECVAGPPGTRLTLGDPFYDDAAPLDTPLIVHGDGATITMNVPEDAIPRDGVLGVTFTAPGDDYFIECNLDRRGFGSGCNGFDRVAAPLGSVEGTETANDDGTTTLSLPADLFQVDADGLWIVIGDMTIRVERVDMSTFGPDGSFAQATLDLDEFIRAIAIE